MADTETLTVAVPVHTKDPRAMFLREVLVEGEVSEGVLIGVPFELSLTGASLVFSMGKMEDPSRVVKLIKIKELTQVLADLSVTELRDAERARREGE